MSAQLFLINGGLANTETRSRTAVVEMMADDLVEFDAYAVEADAIRALVFWGRYTTLEVMHCLPDARRAAMQRAVAREMSKP